MRARCAASPAAAKSRPPTARSSTTSCCAIASIAPRPISSSSFWLKICRSLSRPASSCTPDVLAQLPRPVASSRREFRRKRSEKLRRSIQPTHGLFEVAQHRRDVGPIERALRFFTRIMSKQPPRSRCGGHERPSPYAVIADGCSPIADLETTPRVGRLACPNWHVIAPRVAAPTSAGEDPPVRYCVGVKPPCCAIGEIIGDPWRSRHRARGQSEDDPTSPKWVIEA